VTAAAALREASAAGVSLRLVDGTAKVAGAPSAELLARLREHKQEIVEILGADRCRWCGERLAWPIAVGVILGNDTAECMCCADREVWRITAAAERGSKSSRVGGRDRADDQRTTRMTMLGSFLVATMLDEAGRRRREAEGQTAADARLLVSWLRTRTTSPRMKDVMQRAALELCVRERREKAIAWLEQRGRLRREPRKRGHVLVLL
jgi:hypothetical protein